MQLLLMSEIHNTLLYNSKDKFKASMIAWIELNKKNKIQLQILNSINLGILFMDLRTVK